jgi:hypothetical protein
MLWYPDRGLVVVAVQGTEVLTRLPARELFVANEYRYELPSDAIDCIIGTPWFRMAIAYTTSRSSSSKVASLFNDEEY